MNKHIEIEQMLFGDYRVQVWNDRFDSELDREYFCRGELSAKLTAFEIRSLPSFETLDIYIRQGGAEPVLLDKYNKNETDRENITK
jgi:hypothetical protein